MAVPDPSALPPAAATPNPLASLLIGVLLFVVVIAVIVVVMAILQAVLPKTDTGAEAVHRQEREREEGGVAVGPPDHGADGG